MPAAKKHDVNLITRVEMRSEELPEMFFCLRGTSIRGESVSDGDIDPIWNHIARDAALDTHRKQRLVVTAALYLRLPRFVGGQVCEEGAQAVDRVATFPRTRGVGPLPAKGDACPHRALAPGLESAVGGLAEQRKVTDEEIGADGEQLSESAVLRSDFLPRVEDI